MEVERISYREAFDVARTTIIYHAVRRSFRAGAAREVAMAVAGCDRSAPDLIDRFETALATQTIQPNVTIGPDNAMHVAFA